MSNLNQDIQASHKILDLLENANAQSEAIIDGLPGVFMILNEQGEILRGNTEAARVLDVDPEDLLRTECSRLFKLEAWQIFQEHLQQLLDSGEASVNRFELAVSGGESLDDDRPFYWRLARIDTPSSAEGKLFYLIGEDISELRETESKLSSVFANIPLGILTIDEEGRIEDTYSSYLIWLLGGGDFYGKPFREIVFDPIRQDLSDEELQGVRNIELSLNNDERHFDEMVGTFPSQIYFYHNKNSRRGGKYLQISYKPVIYDGVVKRLLVILEDRTKVVEAEKERERADLIERQSRAIYESAIRDPLTGLFTRLYMEDRVEALLNSHNRRDVLDVALVMFDIDHFKPFNDNFGHDVGDRVLKQVAAVMLKQVRKPDIPVRFGGEEFMVFIAGNTEAASKLAERVRKKVAAMPLKVEDQEVQITISGGVASHRDNESLDQLIKRADQMLYKAKREGRNRIEIEGQ
ncbi:GGDEF domain-containing protein [Marinobacteraceae bacterium S3BR75-40.1]